MAKEAKSMHRVYASATIRLEKTLELTKAELAEINESLDDGDAKWLEGFFCLASDIDDIEFDASDVMVAKVKSKSKKGV